MNNKGVIGLLIANALLLAGILVVLLVRQPPDKKPSYEYDVGAIPDTTLTDSLNRLGGEGWEVVFARRARGEDDKMAYEMILKRLR